MTSWIAVTVPFADAWGMHDGDVGFGWWLVMTLGMIVFWGAVIAVVVWALRGGARSEPAGSPPAREASAREILDRRLAEGSVDIDEYERRRRLLEGAAGTPSPVPPSNALGGSA